MLAGLIALTFAAAFCSAALYINIAEHPARMGLNDSASLGQWGPSYDRAFNYQGGLAVAAAAAGFAQGWLSSDWRWAVGATLMLANWPYTLIVILPLNHQLKAIRSDEAGPNSRAMLGRWNNLNAVRTGLSAFALLIYLWCAARL